jgi:hypothetical protein
MSLTKNMTEELRFATLLAPLSFLIAASLLIGKEAKASDGEASDWTMGHVRAGQEVFRKEIEEAGLTYVADVQIDGFKDNYVMRFRKE